MSLQNGGSGWPPDTIGDVGPNHYVQMVNTSLAIFDKNGTQLTGPTSINQLWQGQGNPCETCNDGDPVVVYDQLADRWLLSQFGVCDGPPYYECVAISQTADPTAAYYLYAFEIPDNRFPDYPKFGVWPDAYYMSANESDVGVYAFDRDKMLAGEPASFQEFEEIGNFMLPCDLDGSTPPPSDSPNYFYTMKPGNVLEIWEFHVDFDVPSNSTFTLAQTLNTIPFNYGVCGFSWDCIPQKDTSQRLDVISEWPMWRLQYRNFGTHETLLGNFTVDVGDFTDHAGIRWFELRKSNGSWSIHQEGTHAPDEHHRWMGSIAMDGAGNIALGYSVSSDTLFPSIRYATRLASGVAGILQAEVSVVEGTASQTNTNRWGDYSSMNVDPSDDATFWYTNEYLADSTQGWQTRIVKFKIQPTAITGSAVSVTESSVTLNGTVNPNGTDTGAYFEYGMDQNYGSITTNISVDSGGGDVSVNADISGLRDHTTYHYRLAATNESGTSYGDDDTFTTLAIAEVVNQAVADGSGSSGCFIATAAFGFPMQPYVKILREFRNRILLNNSIGKALVNFYYKYSPPMADCISRHDSLRAMVRIFLLPVVGMSWMALKFGPASTLGLLLLFALMSAAGLILFRKIHLQRYGN
jgi:hypothetical protein